MNHIRIDAKTRLERLNISMAQTIFETIYKEREYLKIWLPFVDFTVQPADTEAFISSVNKPDKKDIIYSIWYNETFAGLIGFKDIDSANKKTEIGYWLSEKMQGKGIITKCLSKLVSFAFNRLKLNRVQIKVAVENHKSLAIPERLGFYFEGIEREGEFITDKYNNLKVFSKLKNQWLH